MRGMLQRLEVQNLAVIREAVLELAPGLRPSFSRTSLGRVI